MSHGTHGHHAAIDSLYGEEWADELCDSLGEERFLEGKPTEIQEEAKAITRRLIEIYSPDHFGGPNPTLEWRQISADAN